jgi:hypothetical protein
VKSSFTGTTVLSPHFTVLSPHCVAFPTVFCFNFYCGGFILFLMCVCVCVCGFCNVCVCEGFVMCECFGKYILYSD